MGAFFDNLGGPPNKVFDAAPAKIVFKDSIRVIQIANNQIEAREVTCSSADSCELVAKKPESGPYWIERTACA